MVVALGMLLNAGKKLKEACATRAVPAQFMCHCYPPNQSGYIARKKRLQLLSSFLCYFSLSYLNRPSMGAKVGRFERFVFLFLALFFKRFVSVFWGSNFLEFLNL